MDAVFLQLVNMSITASWLILAVTVVRLLFKKAPRHLLCALWAVVALRLICPFSVESMFSLIPTAQPIPQEILYSPSPAIDSGIPSLNQTINPILSESLSPNPGDSVNPIQILTAVAANIWILGVITLLIYAVVSYLRVYRKVRISLAVQPHVYICDEITTPFILGIIKPRIYLPSTLSKSDTDYVLYHEFAHIKRHDHWWKPLGFALLTVYWFNPLVWLGYVLLCRDIELACDERVIRDMDKAETAGYTQALLHCSTKQRAVTACPLAFGESGVKSRIKNALHYKKPTLWILLTSAIACIVVTLCFFTNPTTPPPSPSSDSELSGVSISVKNINLHNDPPTITILYQNDTANEITYGEPFMLHRFERGHWVNTNLVKNSAFNAIGYMLAPYKTVEKDYSVASYNLSENGTYRFETSVSIHGGDATSYKMHVIFTVEDGGTALPLNPVAGTYTVEEAVLRKNNDTVRIVYPTLKSEDHDYTPINSIVLSNIESKLYDLQHTYPRDSMIDIDYRITHQDDTLISVLFEGTVAPPNDDPIGIAFTACLAPGNNFTVNPDSLFTVDEAFLKAFREKWLSLWDGTTLTAEQHHNYVKAINAYSDEQLLEILRDENMVNYGFTPNGVLVVFYGKPSLGDYALIEVPPDSSLNTDAATPEQEESVLYTYTASPDPIAPTLRLYNNAYRFEFQFFGSNSYFAVGTYNLTNDELILRTANGKVTYTFSKTEQGFVFNALKSSVIPSFLYMPNGALFQKASAVTKEPSMNQAILSAVGKPYTAVAQAYGEVTDIIQIEGGPAYAFESGYAYYSFGGYEEVDWGYELSDGEAFPRPPSDENGKWIPETAPHPKSDSVCRWILYVPCRDLFTGLTAPTDAATLASAYKIEHAKSYYSPYNENYLVIFHHQNLQICIETASDYLIGPDSIVDRITVIRESTPSPNAAVMDYSPLAYESVYCTDEQATTRLGIRDGVIYIGYYRTENGKQTTHIDRLENGVWQTVETDVDLASSPYFDTPLSYPLQTEIEGGWSLYDNNDGDIFLASDTHAAHRELRASVHSQRLIVTDYRSMIVMLSSEPTKQGENYVYEVRIYRVPSTA